MSCKPHKENNWNATFLGRNAQNGWLCKSWQKKKHLASCKIAELGEVGGAMGKRPCTGTTLKPVFGLKSRGVLLGVYRRK